MVRTPRAWLLAALLALLAHQVVMATPLHAAAMHLSQPALATTESEHDRHASGALIKAWLGQAEHPGDCAVESAPPPTGPSLRLLPGSTPPIDAPTIPAATLPAGPIPLAHGPPNSTDPQALLQVFRI